MAFRMIVATNALSILFFNAVASSMAMGKYDSMNYYLKPLDCAGLKIMIVFLVLSAYFIL